MTGSVREALEAIVNDPKATIPRRLRDKARAALRVQTSPGAEVLAVFKQGVYRHECGGIFTSPAVAEEVACKLAADDRDDYHAWQVVPFTLDTITPGEANALTEAKPIFEVQQASDGETASDTGPEGFATVLRSAASRAEWCE